MSTSLVSCKDGDVEVDIIICPTSTGSSGYFRPCDRLQGHIRISSKEPLQLSRVEIYLRGAAKSIPSFKVALRSPNANNSTGSQSITTVAGDATKRSRSHRVSLHSNLFPSDGMSRSDIHALYSFWMYRYSLRSQMTSESSRPIQSKPIMFTFSTLFLMALTMPPPTDCLAPAGCCRPLLIASFSTQTFGTPCLCRKFPSPTTFGLS